jgi:signal transduction histidine kinase
LASRSAVIHSQIEPILKDHDFSQLRTPLLQILVNLLNNSLEANASLMKISLKSALKYKLVLEVNDNGQGIPPDQLPQIFQTGVTTKPEPGHGLGLAIVHELVTKHLNGEISVSSTLGQETTFLITWPISPN